MMLCVQLQSRLLFFTFYFSSPQSFLFLLFSLRTIIHRLNALRLDLQRGGSEGRDGLAVLSLFLFACSASLFSGGFSHCVENRFQVVEKKQLLRDKKTKEIIKRLQTLMCARGVLPGVCLAFFWPRPLFRGLGVSCSSSGSLATRSMLSSKTETLSYVTSETSRRPHSILLG